MSPEELVQYEIVTVIIYYLALAFSLYALRQLTKSSSNYKESIKALDQSMAMEAESMAKFALIYKYRMLKHCAFDLDECTVTIAFDSKEQTMDFLDSHESKSRVKIITDDKVVRHSSCEGCDEDQCHEH